MSARGARLKIGNVPVLGLVSFRWMVLRGSVVYDLALTRRAAVRRLPDDAATLAKVWPWDVT